MEQRWQFSTRFLLLELGLIAVGLAICRWLYLSMNNTITSDVERTLEIIAFPVIAVIFGTSIGGFFQRSLDGAILGFVMLLPGGLAASLLIQMFRLYIAS